MKRVFITCSKCGGAGSITLPLRLMETLAEIRHTPGFTIQELLDRFTGIGQAAVNKRLVELEALGLVRRERKSHAWRWFPTK